MSSRIDVDVAELERFVQRLIQFNQELENSTHRINGQFQELGSSWRDGEYQKFAEEWSSTYSSINKYLQNCMGYVKHLKSKAAKLRDAQH